MPQYCTFRVAELELAVDVLRVQEVIRQQEMTPVPLAHTSVCGLINLRGQIVTAMDLRRRLELPPGPPGLDPIEVVVRADDAATALVVDEIGDVVDLEADTFEPSPETLRGPLRSLVVGVHKLDGRLLLVLDIERVVRVARAA